MPDLVHLLATGFFCQHVHRGLHPLHNRFQHRWIKSLDVTVFGDVWLGVTENPPHDRPTDNRLEAIPRRKPCQPNQSSPMASTAGRITRWANLSISMLSPLPLWNMAPVVGSPMDARYSSSRLASLGITRTGCRLVRVCGRFTTPFQTERLTAIASPV